MSEYKFKPIMFGPKTYFSLANKLMDVADMIDKGKAIEGIDKYVPTGPERWIENSFWKDYCWEPCFKETGLENKCRTVASAIYSEGASF
jgi:hypothetical protein